MQSNNRDPQRISRILKKLETEWRKCPEIRLGQLIVNLASIGNRSIVAPEIFYLEDGDLEELLDEVGNSSISKVLDAGRQEQEEYPNVAHEVASIRADLKQAANNIHTLGYLGAPNEDGKCILDAIEDTADAIAKLEGALRLMGAGQRQMQDKLDLILQKLGEPMGPQFHSSHEVKGRQPA